MLINIRTPLTVGTAFALLFAAVFATAGGDEPAKGIAKTVVAKDDPAKKSGASPLPEKVGVLLNDSRAFPGYNLINPGRKQTYLYDNEGRVMHSWTSEYSSGSSVYLLENGHLFRPAEAAKHDPRFPGPGRQRPIPGIRLGRQSRLGIRVSQRKAIAAP